MSFVARQSTARTYMVGPVLDADGVAVTGGVVADFEASKNGADPAALDGSATLTHRNTGHYSLALTANDHDTVGTLQIVINDTVNACPMLHIQVIEPAVYDALFADAATGTLPANVTQVLGTAVTEGASGRLAGGIVKFFNVASPTGTVNSIPDAVAGAAGGLTIAGSNAATTFATLTVSGAVAFQSTFAVTTSTALAALSCTTLTASGAVAFQSTFAVTTSTNLAALSCSTFAASGTVTYNAFTVTNATTLSGAVTVTGAITATNAANALRLSSFTVDSGTIIATFSGNLVGDVQGKVLGGGLGTITGTGAWALDSAGAALATAAELAKVPKSDSNVTWNATAAAQIQTEANDALVANHLDHLIASADPGAIVANSSLWAALTSKSATPAYSSYVNTTDSLEAQRDNVGTVGAALVLGSGALANVTAWTVAITGNITGNLSGSVGSVTGAVGSVTGAVGSVTGNVGGNVTGSVGSVLGAINTTSGVITTLDALDTAQDSQHATTQAKTNLLPESPAKNTAFTYVVKMVDSTDHVTPKTGLTVTMTRSLDGAAFGAATGTVTEISTGHYKVVASAADMNGDVVTHRFTGTAADDFSITMVTTA